MAMFDPSKMTILVQAAGGSGDWRMWHYTVADDATMDNVTADGFFSPMHRQITPMSIVYVTATTFVAQLAMLKKDNAVTTEVMAVAEFAEDDSDLPHVQGVPNQPDGNMPIDQANMPNTPIADDVSEPADNTAAETHES